MGARYPSGRQARGYLTCTLGEDGSISHRVELSFFPNRAGSIQERLYCLGSDRLTLSTRLVHSGCQLRTSHLVRERASRSRAALQNKCCPHIKTGAVQMTFDLMGCLQEKGLEVVDKRASGGALWVVGGTELAPLMDELKARGIAFSRAPQGGRASRHRPAWFTKWTESAAS
jgi:hypothetical protein